MVSSAPIRSLQPISRLPSHTRPLRLGRVDLVPIRERIILVLGLLLRFRVLVLVSIPRSPLPVRRYRWGRAGIRGAEMEPIECFLRTPQSRRLAFRRRRAILPLPFAVAIVLEALIQDLVRHERGDEFLVCVDQAAEPLLAFDVVDISQNLASEQFARFKPLNGCGIFTDALVLSVDEFQRVEEVRAGDGG